MKLEQLLNEEEKQNIISDYRNNVSVRSLSEKYHHGRKALSTWLESIGEKTTKGNHYRKYFHDEDFFENIDTEEKAYWLGFMFADGYIQDNTKRYGQDKFGLSLAQDSLDSIEKFKKSLKATNPITWDYSGQKYKKQPLCKLVLTSQKTVNDLIDKGCFKQKTLILQPPKNIPDDLIHHFVRGFFDGDGCITGEKVHPSGQFTTTYNMACWLKSFFDFGSIVKERRREYTYYFSFGGINCTRKIYEFMYKDATIYMERKFRKFQEILF